MPVLITGGSGFVGLNVAEHLCEQGESVVLFAPSPPPAEALRALQTKPGRLSTVAGDVTVASDLDAAMTEQRIDRIVHAAAITADLERERRMASAIFTVNVLGTVEVMEAALRHGIKRVVHVSTGSVFGETGHITEWLDEASPTLPVSLYGISKLAAERTVLRYRQTRGLDVTAVRLGMVFGKWEYETGVRDTLSMALQLARVAEAGARAVVHTEAGDDWIYSADVASGLVSVLDRYDLPEPLYHLSAGGRWSIENWCQLLKESFPQFEYAFSHRMEDCTVKRNAPVRRSPMSIGLMQRDAGYVPAFPLRQAFRDYSAWRRSHRPFLDATRT
jgi:dTDP-glucose 4,6-dehydratase